MQTEKKDKEFRKAVPGAGEAKLVVGLLYGAIQTLALLPLLGKRGSIFQLFSNSSRAETLTVQCYTFDLFLLVWWKNSVFRF